MMSGSRGAPGFCAKSPALHHSTGGAISGVSHWLSVGAAVRRRHGGHRWLSGGCNFECDTEIRHKESNPNG